MTTLKKETLENEMVLNRIFNAPVDLVWKALSTPEHMMRWWGPKGFTSPNCKIDFRVGGKYHFCMRSPEGQDIWTTGIYKEIVLHKKIVWTDNFADEKGNVVPGDYYGMPGLPMEFEVTMILEATEGKTKFTLRHKGLPDGEMTELTLAGWHETFDKLAATLQ
jgi:uncharacterized protein YndB with AHSA1/START domain